MEGCFEQGNELTDCINYEIFLENLSVSAVPTKVLLFGYLVESRKLTMGWHIVPLRDS